MPPNQHLKGGLIVRSGKTFNQFPIRGAALPACQKLAQLVQDSLHVTNLPCEFSVSAFCLLPIMAWQGLAHFPFLKNRQPGSSVHQHFFPRGY